MCLWEQKAECVSDVGVDVLEKTVITKNLCRLLPVAKICTSSHYSVWEQHREPLMAFHKGWGPTLFSFPLFNPTIFMCPEGGEVWEIGIVISHVPLHWLATENNHDLVPMWAAQAPQVSCQNLSQPLKTGWCMTVKRNNMTFFFSCLQITMTEELSRL